MKRVFCIALLASSLCAMNDQIQHCLTIEDGGDKRPFQLAFDVFDENTKIYVQTDEDALDSHVEHDYLDGLCSAYTNLAYGAIDLRRLEEQIAKARGGKQESKFQHAWDSGHSDRLVKQRVTVLSVFSKSANQIASPCEVPVLSDGVKLRLLSNLRNRWEAILFASSLLKPSMTDGQRPTVDLSILEKAVLAELEDEATPSSDESAK